jgi:Cyclic nucleotide-binding domain
MRIEKSVTAISWIPSEAISGMPKVPFELGIGNYDPPPPDRLTGGDLERLRDEDRYREANLLRAWIDVDDDGKVTDAGYSGAGYVGSTTFSFKLKSLVVPGVAFELLRSDPEITEGSARFVQTVGGRAGFPAPRRVRGKPFFRVQSATAWTTLGLTIDAGGSHEHELVGASPFPRHWIYDDSGQVVLKAGTIDFGTWYRESHGDNTPWGQEDSPAVVTAAESELERQLSRELMTSGTAAKRRRLAPGETLVTQGDVGNELYLLLDGVLLVEVGGQEVAEVGPGSIIGERAVLEGGTRTATLRAQTPARVAVIPGEAVEPADLDELAVGRRREETS